MSFGKKAEIQMSFLEKLSVGYIGAGVAATVCHPIDVTKVRLQVRVDKSESVLKILKNMAIDEGIFSYYRGLDASLMRQLVYSSLRLGMYPVIKNMMEKEGEEILPMYKKITAGVLSGAIGAFFGSPNDLVLIRLQSGAFGYKNIFEGLYKTFRSDGLFGLWRGSSPTVLRGCVVNASQVACYDCIKTAFLTKTKLEDNKGTHFLASSLAGVVCTILSNPVDVVKTKLMNMKPNELGELPYKGIMDCFKKIYKKEGFAGYYAGFFPSMCRQIPLTIITLMVYEKAASLSIKLFHKKELEELRRRKEGEL